MKAAKRVIALAIMLCMIFPLLPGELPALLELKASAADDVVEVGDGTEGSPYQIKDINEFEYYMRKYGKTAGKHYKQTGPIDFKNPIQVGTDWALAGVYDGDGQPITVSGNGGMKSFDGTTYDRHVGVFSMISGDKAVVKNLNVILDNVSYTANNTVWAQRIGGITGHVLHGAVVENCSVSGTLNVHANVYGKGTGVTIINGVYLGGIAGDIWNGTVKNCNVSKLTINYTTDSRLYSLQPSFPYMPSYYEYYAEVGGISGRSGSSAVSGSGGNIIENCMIEDTTINAANDYNSSVTSFNFVGGILGRAIDEANLVVKNNTFRNTRLYANYNLNMGIGYAASLIGRTSMQPLPSTVANNYHDMSVTDMAFGKIKGIRHGNANYFYTTATGYNVSDAVLCQANATGNSVITYDATSPSPSPAQLGDSGMNIWVNDVVDVNGNYLPYRGAAEDEGNRRSVLKWMTTDAPTVIEDEENPIKPGEPNQTITLQAPKKIFPFSNTALWSGENIRYVLTYEVEGKGEVTTPGQLAAPIIETAEIANNILTLGLKDDGAGDETKTLQYRIGNEVYKDYAEYPVIDLGDYYKEHNAGTHSVSVYVRFESKNSNYNDSDDSEIPITVTITAAGPDNPDIAIERDGAFSNGGTKLDPVFGNKTVRVEYVDVGTYEDVNGEYHSHEAKDNTLVITLKEPVADNTIITIDAYMLAKTESAPERPLYPRRLPRTVQVGLVTDPPSISPGPGGSLADGITITGVANSTISWTITKNGSSSPGPLTSGSGVEPITILDTALDLDGDWETLVVTAKAQSNVSGYTESAPTTVIYTYHSKPRADPPTIKLDNAAINSKTYYLPTSPLNVTLEHEWSGSGEIFYVIGDHMPNKDTSDKYAQAIALAKDKSTVKISAVLVRKNYPDSLIATEAVNIRTPHGAPLFSIENTSGIPSGQPLSMLIPEEDLPPILRPEFYMKKDSDQRYTYSEVKNEPGAYYGVIEVYDGFVRGLPFTKYSDYEIDVPNVTYKIGENGTEKTYMPTVPAIHTYGKVNDEWQLIGDTPYSMHTITLTGAPNTTIKVDARLTSKNQVAHTDGSYLAKPMEYTIYPAVAAPKAAPATNNDNVLSVNIGTTISLSCETPTVADKEVKIFYSLTGTPTVEYDTTTGEYTPFEGTKEYKPAEGITVTGKAGSYFVVYAGAFRPDMSASEIAVFTYKIADLNKVAEPVATPATTPGKITTVENGTSVILVSATAGAKIFYSTQSVPDVEYLGNNNYKLGSGTEDYDKVRSSGITISGNPGEIRTIYAVAMKDGMGDSDVVTLTYQLPAPVQAVLATPGEGVVIKGTTVALTTTTAGATIFYEVASGNNTADDPVPYESQVYDASKPIIIEQKTSISAIAVKDNVSSITTEYSYTLAADVAAPVPSVPSGSVVAKGSRITLESPTSGASIVYTKDGSDPADAKNTKRMYGSDIVLDAEEGKSVNISAYATKTGMTPSPVVSLSYSISKSEDVLSANPPPDTVVRPGDKITLSTAVTGAKIYYTTDGSEPTTSSESGSTVTVSGIHGDSFVIRAITSAGNISTAPTIFSYRIIPRTPMPGASIPNGAIILEGAEVVLTAPEGNIYYTTDGSEPTESSQLYTEKLKLTGSTVLKAVAKADNKAASEVAEYIYTMAGQVAAPTASMPSGAIEIGSKITLRTDTEGATIYYTTNGVAPTADNLKDATAYDAPITISRPVSIKMFAVSQGMRPSVVNTATYTVTNPEIKDEDEDGKALSLQTDSDKLFLFDQFVGNAEGPLYEDLVLRDNVTMTVVSAQQDALPEGVQLVVIRDKSPSVEDAEAVSRALELQLASLYNITLVMNGEPVQPQKENAVEVGVPIPDGYEDTVVLICRINDNGTVTAFPTRRSGDMVYAVVDHFSKYAVAVPPQTQKAASSFGLLHIVSAAVVLLSAGALTFIIIKKRKEKKV